MYINNVTAPTFFVAAYDIREIKHVICIIFHLLILIHILFNIDTFLIHNTIMYKAKQSKTFKSIIRYFIYFSNFESTKKNT